MYDVQCTKYSLLTTKEGSTSVLLSLYFEGTDTASPSHLEGTVAFCGAYARNRDNSFYACAFIIRLNNPISCEHNRLISPYNKKENSFF